MPLLAGVGTLGGLLRDLAPSHEEIWRFSPFLDLSLYRLVRRRVATRPALFHVLCIAAILFAEFLRYSLARVFGPKLIFSIYPWPQPHTASIVAVFVTTLFAITLPLKIWNSSRNERKLDPRGGY